jgi:hypothetical protein
VIKGLVAWLAPYLLWIAFGAGLVVAAGPLLWFHGVRIESKDLEIERLTAAISLAKQQADAKAAAAQLQIDAIVSAADLAALSRRTEYVEIVREVKAVTSPDRQCLGPAAVRVLRRAEDRRDAARPDPGVAPDPGPGPAPDSGGPGASEQAVAQWMAAVRDQYVTVRDRHRDLAAAVRRLPCVEVVD